MRANSLTNLGVALDYNVVSDYDKVLVVAGLASEIEELAPHSNEIANLVANLPDVLTVQEASELVNNLTVKVTTLPAGSAATSELVGTEIRLGIPAGTQGVQGLQGPKGDKGDKGDIGLTGAQGPIGLTGPQGPRGLRGNDGVDGVGVEITSILNNPNKSLTINFSDGTQHTTDPLKGKDGTSVTVTNIVNNANGTMQINFSDGTSHTTANLTGPRGFKGDTGDHVHHVSYIRSKDSLGNEIGSVKPSQRGYTDIYAMWASQEELPEMYIGEFTVYNGLDTLSAEDQYKFDSIEFGATADQEAFEVVYDSSVSGLVAGNVQEAIDNLNATTIKTAEKGQPDGVASLDSNGLVPAGQLPSYVDDVLEVATYLDLPIVGESGKIYIVVNDETSGGDTSSYRWTGTVYAMVSNTLTAEDVKALYESNINTNVFTDDEKTKLDGLETSTQLDARDTANRDRANHTGTQLASTISDFDSAVEGSTQVVLNTTKLAGIEEGATADQTAAEIEALYESNIDTNKYTDAEKSMVAVSVSLQTTAQTLPDAINEIDSRLDGKVDTSVVEGLNVFRADKVLASKDVVNLIYSAGNLVKIRYNTDSDVDYEVLTYVGEDLTNVAHYIDGILQGNTVLTYSGGDLVSSIFIGV